MAELGALDALLQAIPGYDALQGLKATIVRIPAASFFDGAGAPTTKSTHIIHSTAMSMHRVLAPMLAPKAERCDGKK